MTKTYLEQLDSTGALKLLRRYQENQLSPMIHAMRYTLLAMYGDRDAAKLVRGYIRSEEKNTDPIIKVVIQLLKDRVDNLEWNHRALPYLQGYNTEGIPFTHFESDPAQISQIKKIINALYHAEKALIMIEGVSLDSLSRATNNNAEQVIEMLSGEFSDHCYELAILLTHPDIDLYSTFGNESALIKNIVTDLFAKIPAFFKDVEQYLSHEHNVNIPKSKELVHKFGEISGMLVHNLKPNTEANFSSISYFSADLSTQINKLTQSIQKSANLYFNETKYLNQERKNFEKYQMDPARLKVLDEAAGKLAKSFEGLYAPGILQPLNVLGFANIARNAFTLVINIMEEAGNFNTESVDLIKAILAELKYKGFLNIITSLDKIEEEVMLRPGILSAPVAQGLDEFYKAVFGLVEGFVDISAQGQDLSTLIESRFVDLRVQASIEREAEREKENFKQKELEKEIDTFFDLLKEIHIRYPRARLRDLNDETKAKLKEKFKKIQTEVSEADVKLSNAIVNGLNHSAPPTLLEEVYDQFNVFTQNIAQDWVGDYPDRIQTILNQGYSIALLPIDLPNIYLRSGPIYLEAINGRIAYTIKKQNGDVISKVLTGVAAPAIFTIEHLRPLESEIVNFAVENGHIPPSLFIDIKNRLRKKETTYHFQTQLNEDIIHSIYRSLDTLTQQAYPVDQNFFELDELALLISGKYIDKSVTYVTGDNLTLNGAYALYEAYAAKRDKLEYIEQSFSKFMDHLARQNGSTSLALVADINQVRNDYTIFQPAFISALKSLESEKSALAVDKAIISALAGRKGDEITLNDLTSRKNVIQRYIQTEKLKINGRLGEIESFIQHKQPELNASELSLMDETRATYLIKKPFFDEFNRNAEKKVKELILCFSKKVQSELVPDEQRTLLDKYLISQIINFESGVLPFPEVEPSFAKIDSAIQFYQQPKEILALKKLINCLYHLKETSIQLEQLNEHSHKKIYVWRLYQIQRHMLSVNDMLLDIVNDPYISVLAKDVTDQFQKIYQTFETLRKPYAPPRTADASNVEVHDAVFYIVNSLMILTRQIEKAQTREFVTEEAAKKVQKFSEGFADDVRRIIDKSDSYLALLGEIGTSIGLLTKIKNRWKNFAKALHNSVEQNLESINTTIFTETLLELDEWEYKLGLKPGLLSDPLKEIFDAYYQGLIKALSNNAWHEIDLATSMHGLHIRIEATHKRIKLTEQELLEIQARLKIATDFNQLWSENEVNMFQVFTSPQISNPEWVQKTNEFLSFFQGLKQIAPYSITLQQCCTEELWSMLENLVQLDSTHSMVIPDNQKEAFKKSWLQIASVCSAYQQGLVSSVQFRLENAQEQKVYLEQKRKEQVHLNKDFEVQHIQRIIQLKLNKHQSVAKNLLYDRNKLYDKALEGFINQHIPEFISQTTRSEILELQVEKFVQDKVSEFDTQYLEEYQQFNLLKKSVKELQVYISSQSDQLERVKRQQFFDYTWAFENAETLEKKTKLLEKMESILAGETLSLEENKKADPWSVKNRIALFKDEVTTSRFQNELLSYQKFNSASFSLLVQWLVQLLQVLKIYKPETEIIYERLQKSVKDVSPPQSIESPELAKSNNPLQTTRDTKVRFFEATEAIRKEDSEHSKPSNFSKGK